MPERHAEMPARGDAPEDALFEHPLIDGVGRPQPLLPLAAPHGAFQRVFELDDAPRVLREQLALLGEGKIARIPPQELDARLAFELQNAVGHRGLRNEELLRRAREIAEAHHR